MDRLSNGLFKDSFTTEEYINLINKRYSTIPFNDQANQVYLSLGSRDTKELEKIRFASFIIFGRKVGIASLEDACNKLKIDITTLTHPYLRLITIIKALNDGWYPDWQNEEEKKYYWYWNMKDYFNVWSTQSTFHHTYYTNIPSELYLKNEDLAYYAIMAFKSYFEETYK